MIVPVHINHNKLEEVCEADRDEYAICNDYYDEFEVDVEDVEFDYTDIENIVDRYLDDIIDILLKNKRYRETLVKKLAVLPYNT
jgi:hypothetical protein